MFDLEIDDNDKKKASAKVTEIKSEYQPTEEELEEAFGKIFEDMWKEEIPDKRDCF